MAATVYVLGGSGQGELQTIAVPNGAKLNVTNTSQEVILVHAANGELIGAFSRDNIIGVVIEGRQP